jgi:hypothetical protein
MIREPFAVYCCDPSQADRNISPYVRLWLAARVVRDWRV